MFIMHIDTLAALNLERHADLLNEAQMLRSLRSEHNAAPAIREGATRVQASARFTSLPQLVLNALPTRIRAALSH